MDKHRAKKILVVCGEASGDLLGADLISALKKSQSGLDISAVGSQQIKKSGANVIFDADKLAVVGIFEIIRHIATLFKAFRLIKRWLIGHRPDLLILIDYPGFNLRLAKTAKKLGIKVLYYVSPQIWVWHYRRIYHIKKYVDHMMVLFPFEEKLYREKNIPVNFVGHPITENAKPSLATEQIYQQLGFTQQQTIISLLPGSRRQEIKRLLPIMLAALPAIREKIPNCQFAIALAPSLKRSDFPQDLPADVKIIDSNRYNLLSISQAAIVASGTATLEVALLGIPMVITYQLSSLSAPIIRLVANPEYIGLCNIIAEQCVAKEFLQKQAVPEKISDEVIQLLTNKNYREKTLDNLQIVRNKLQAGNVKKQAAEVALHLI